MSTKTVIRMYLNLIFDNEAATADIWRQIGLPLAGHKDKAHTRKNPFKDGNLPGYWSVATETKETYYLEDVTKEMLQLINPYLDKIKNVLTTYDGKATFLVVTEIEDKTPALCFPREFLEIAEYLHAEIDIDLQADLAGVEYDRAE